MEGSNIHASAQASNQIQFSPKVTTDKNEGMHATNLLGGRKAEKLGMTNQQLSRKNLTFNNPTNQNFGKSNSHLQGG